MRKLSGGELACFYWCCGGQLRVGVASRVSKQVVKKRVRRKRGRKVSYGVLRWG